MPSTIVREPQPEVKITRSRNTSATYFIDHPGQLATDRYVWLGPIWY
jgi:hypothetical protein